MEEQLVSIEVAKLAKEKGFDLECREIYSPDGDWRTLYYYEGGGSGWIKNSYITEFVTNNFDVKYTAPTQALLQRWLREVHKIHIEVKHYADDVECLYDVSVHEPKTWDEKDIFTSDVIYKSYEEALEEGLYQSLKLI